MNANEPAVCPPGVGDDLRKCRFRRIWSIPEPSPASIQRRQHDYQHQQAESEAEIVASGIWAGGADAIPAKIDVTSESEWMDLITKVIATHGRLDILVSNAGISDTSVGKVGGQK